MKFITEHQRKKRGGTCYFEFQKGRTGKYEYVCWKEDSLLLHMDIVDRVELYKVIPNFDYYGVTFIDKEKWTIIRSNFENGSEELKEIIGELRPWVEGNFKEYSYFVIHGI